MILGLHSNFPLHLSVPPISSACPSTYCPLLGFISRPHRDELSTPPSDFRFLVNAWSAIFFGCCHLLGVLLCCLFPYNLGWLSIWCNFCLVFVFACNNARSSLARSARLMPFGFAALVQTFRLWMWMLSCLSGQGRWVLAWGSLPLMSKNKNYLCIGLSLLGTDLLFKLKTS